MDAKAEELLKQFQNDYNRILEENFAQTLSENENIRDYGMPYSRFVRMW